MKIEVGKEYKTRGGRRYAVVYSASNNGNNSILAVNTSDHALIWLSDDGKYNRSGKDSEHDLISEAPKKVKVKGFVNVDEDGWTEFFDTAEAARYGSRSNRIACKKIEFEVEEGEGL